MKPMLFYVFFVVILTGFTAKGASYESMNERATQELLSQPADYLQLADLAYEKSAYPQSLAALVVALHFYPFDAKVQSKILLLEKKMNRKDLSSFSFWENFYGWYGLPWLLLGLVLVLLISFQLCWRRGGVSRALIIHAFLLILFMGLGGKMLLDRESTQAIGIVRGSPNPTGIRPKPLETSSVTHELMEGEQVDVLGESVHWYQVRLKSGDFGWIQKNDLVAYKTH